MGRMRIAQLANFVGPTSGGMKVVIEQLGQGYVDAGHTRIFVFPGARDEVVESEAGILVSVRAPKVSEQYRMIFQPWIINFCHFRSVFQPKCNLLRILLLAL